MSGLINDMRNRAVFLHDFYGATPETQEYEIAKWFNRRLGSKQDDHFVRSEILDGFIEEIRKEGIATRLSPAVTHPALSLIARTRCGR
jgi:hypothetical protein